MHQIKNLFISRTLPRTGSSQDGRDSAEAVHGPRTATQRFQGQGDTLVDLYKKLNALPEGPKGEDSELRADGNTDQIRIKRRSAWVTRGQVRRAHQARVRTLVRSAFERQSDKYKNSVDPETWNAKKEQLENAWKQQINPSDASCRPITHRMVNCLTMQFLAIVAPDDWKPPEPTVDPAKQIPRRLV